MTCDLLPRSRLFLVREFLCCSAFPREVSALCTEHFASCPPAQLLPGSTSFWSEGKTPVQEAAGWVQGDMGVQKPFLPQHSCMTQRAAASSSLSGTPLLELGVTKNANTAKSGHKPERRKSQLPSPTRRHATGCRYVSHRHGLQQTAWGNNGRIMLSQGSQAKFLKRPGCCTD